MTGFGRKELVLQTIQCIVEIKTLNGKQFDLNLKLPTPLKQFEIEIRNIIQKKIIRGTTELYISIKSDGSAKPMAINTDLAKQYFTSINTLADELNLSKTSMLQTLLTLPEVVQPATETIDEDVWNSIRNNIEEACDLLIKHRIQEGDMLTFQITNNIATIKKLCEQVTAFEKNRTEKIRDKFNTSIRDFLNDTNFDKNRLEQEIIYYIEKFDITEEKTRLTHHCDYFTEIKESEEIQKGKKLGFILQEIGREINTMGAKANDSSIQKIVVQMKDELEQAKEQLLNVL
jgi:uncharacterized protein (TIGR00255 family)